MLSKRSDRSLWLFVVGAAALGIAPGARAQCALDEIISDDPDSQEFWGGAVGIDGSSVAVGSSEDNTVGGSGNGHGAVEFFKKNGVTWDQVSIEYASDGAAGDQLGASVAIDGQYCAAGAPGEDHTGLFGANLLDAGAVYVYRRTINIFTGAHTWSQMQKLTGLLGGGAGDELGGDVAISGTTIVAGARHTGAGVGSATVWEYDSGSGDWVYQATLTASDGATGDEFGVSVAIEGDTIVVGAWSEDTGFSDNGAAYVFERTGNTWTQSQKLVASDRAAGDEFGWDVSLSGNRLIVSADHDDYAGFSTVGSVYYYTRANSTSNFGFAQKILSPVPASVNIFGGQISLLGDRFAATDVDGNLHIFQLGIFGWSLLSSQTNPDGNGQFPVGVDLEDGLLIAGDIGDDHSGLPNPGAANIFSTERNGSNACASAPDIAEGTHYGCTTDATNDGDASCGTSNTSPDVWYDYIVQCTGRLLVDTRGSNYDTVLSLENPTCSNSFLGCNDDIDIVTDRDSEVRINVVKDQVVRIRVSGFNGAEGAFQLNIREIAPLNDTCANAQAVNGELHFPFGTCEAADSALDETGSTCDADKDVWYNWTPSCTGTAQVSTCGADFDTEIVVFEGSTCPGTPGLYIACNDDNAACGGNGLQSRIRFPVVANQHYLIRVGGFGGDSGSGMLDLNCEACPCDWNQADGLDSQDFFDFLDDFFAGDADFNGVDGTDSQDYFDFLECFFTGCQ